MTNINLETGEFIESEVVVDNLPIDMEIEPKVEMIFPKITFNYEELRSMMSKGLEEYKIEVTYLNIGEAKKLATKLNKLAKTISDTRIKNKKIILEPIDLFEEQMKDLTETAKQGREFILNQVKFFEDKQRDICEIKIKDYMQTKINELFIEDEFKVFDYSDLIKASNITDSLNLKKPCRDTLDSRLNMQLTKQTNKKMRLMQLENECYKAGLKVLLNESDVSNFVLENDFIYNEKLSELIIREQNKQKQIELNFLAEQERKIEQQKRDEELQQKKEDFEIAEQERKEKMAQQVKDAESLEQGKRDVTIIATFKVKDLNTKISDNDIRKSFESKISKISETLFSVEVR